MPENFNQLPFTMQECGDPETVFRIGEASMKAKPPVEIQFSKQDKATLEGDPRYQALTKEKQPLTKLR